jgi:phage terminase large subunit-like protein
VEIARKNGKTALSAGIGLYMLFADGEARPEVYSAATVKDQAKICFSDAVEIVKNTDLKNYLDTLPELHRLRDEGRHDETPLLGLWYPRWPEPLLRYHR